MRRGPFGTITWTARAAPEKKGARRKPGFVPRRGGAAIIPLGRRLPAASSNLPESIGRAGLKRFPIWSCSERGMPSVPRRRGTWWALTPPFHPYRQAEARRRFAFCGAMPGITPPGRYPASCPAEPGLSSPGFPAATACPTPDTSVVPRGGLSRLSRWQLQPQRLRPGCAGSSRSGAGSWGRRESAGPFAARYTPGAEWQCCSPSRCRDPPAR